MTADGENPPDKLPLKILIIAAAYFAAGSLTLMTGIPPVIETGVWLPAGIALAGTLAWGYRVWPGILLGAFGVQAAFYGDGAGTATLLKTLVPAALIGAGAALQGIAGTFLILKFVGFPKTADRSGALVKILLLGGPVGCLVGAAVGRTIAWGAGLTQAAGLSSHWWHGWLADILGVLIILPLVSVWMAERSRVSLRMRMLVMVPVGLAAVLTVLAFFDLRAGNWRQVRAEFKRIAQVMVATLNSTVDYHFETLYSIEGLFDASQTVERQGFQIFVRRLFERHSGIQALEWVPRVPHEQRSAYEAAARRDGFSAFQITERGSGNQMVAAARREEYYPAYYVEPFGGNEPVLGFDLASTPERRAAINSARDSGKITATARLTLVQEPGQQFGVVVFVPVYSGQGGLNTAAAHRSALRGFVSGVFRIGDMVTHALKAFDTDAVRYTLSDLTAPAGEQLLWKYDPGSRSDAAARQRVRQAAQAAGLNYRDSFDMGGRNWSISFAPTYHYLAAHRSWDAGLVLACGLLFSSLVGALLLAISGRSAELSAANTRLQNEISERAQTEARLYESRQKFRGLVESAPDAILIVDHQGKVTFANPQVETVFGYRVGEILGQSHDILLPERLQEAHAVHRANYRDAPHTRLMGTGLELFGRRKDGSEFPVEIGLSALQTNQESEVICIVRDISDRKRSEDALREREAQLWQIIDLVPHMIFAKDAEGRFVLVNRYMAEAYGTSPKNLSGTFQADHHHNREELAQFQSGDRRVLETGRSQSFPQMTFTDARGKQRILQVTKIPFRAAGTNAPGVLGVAVDITDLKQIEDALKKSQAGLEIKVEARTRELKLAVLKAQEADQLKSAFLASMSHELRTPLNSIIGFTGILLQGIVGPLNDEQQKQLGMVQSSARHLLSLINEVLDLSKIEAGQLEVARETFRVKDAVEKVIQTVSPLADKKRLDLMAEIAPEVDEITSDRKRLEQILINLVNNAVKFTENGSVQLSCRVEKNRLVIQVTDTGIGIKSENLDKIFRAFQQLDTGLARRYEGTGLGLSISRKLTELLGGHIHAESDGPGRGSTFTVSLPL